MKNKKTVFALFFAISSLVLGSCANPFLPNRKPSSVSKDDSLTSEIDTNHRHQYGEWVVVKEATCTEDGTQVRTCKICGQEQTKAIIASHQWSDWNVYIAPTCSVEGTKERTCIVCGAKEIESVPKTGHNYTEYEYVTEPTCEQEGIMRYYCVDCGNYYDVTVPANGHYFPVDEYGEEIIEWQKEPTCTEGGQGTKTCLICNTKFDVSFEPLGHDLVVIGNEIVPEQGKAEVRVYQCSRCHQTYLGFQATDVSPESKQRLVFDDDGGARFFGRPIGNSMPLDDTGSSINQQNGECVYNRNEKGDFFEFIFDLTEEQVKALGETCMLYCDAKPADYLNGTDFWAYGRYNDEWTPGFYIDGAPEHLEYEADGVTPVMVDELDANGNKTGYKIQKGKRVSDYRYVLYVDDQVVDFDPSIQVPSRGSGTNMIRDYYVVPYYFHLHTGTNKISLHMAGGYRSTFYSFTFKPYAEVIKPEPSVLNNWPMDEIEAHRSDSGWLADKDWGNGVTGFKFNRANGYVELSYTSESSRKATLQLMIAVKQSNIAKTGFWRQDGIEKTAIEINGVKVEPSDELDFTGSTQSSVNDNGPLSVPEWFNIVELDLVEGVNTIKITYLTGGYAYYLCGARLVV